MDKNELTMQDIKLNELLKQTYHGIFFDHLRPYRVHSLH